MAVMSPPKGHPGADKARVYGTGTKPAHAHRVSTGVNAGQGVSSKTSALFFYCL